MTLAEPLLWLTVTLAAYWCADRLYQACGQSAWLNSVVVTIAALVAILLATDTSYRTYFEANRFIHFLLGPATVALAVPLVQRIHELRGYWRALLVALIAGSITAVMTALAIGWLVGLPRSMLVAMLPKSATTPIAMPVAAGLGGDASLTAVLVIITGLVGAVVGLPLMRGLGVKSPVARGLALGVSAHGLGTARAYRDGPITGAYSGLAMGLNGLATAILVPFIVWLVGL